MDKILKLHSNRKSTNNQRESSPQIIKINKSNIGGCAFSNIDSISRRNRGEMNICNFELKSFGNKSTYGTKLNEFKRMIFISNQNDTEKVLNMDMLKNPLISSKLKSKFTQVYSQGLMDFNEGEFSYEEEQFQNMNVTKNCLPINEEITRKISFKKKEIIDILNVNNANNSSKKSTSGKSLNIPIYNHNPKTIINPHTRQHDIFTEYKRKKCFRTSSVDANENDQKLTPLMDYTSKNQSTGLMKILGMKQKLEKIIQNKSVITNATVQGGYAEKSQMNPRYPETNRIHPQMKQKEQKEENPDFFLDFKPIKSNINDYTQSQLRSEQKGNKNVDLAVTPIKKDKQLIETKCPRLIPNNVKVEADHRRTKSSLAESLPFRKEFPTVTESNKNNTP